MSSRKTSDRLGRNPFDRGSYKSAGAKAKAGTKARTKKKASTKRARKENAPAWRLLLNELNRRSPRAIRELRICERVSALAELATAYVNRQFEL
jgi:hypothetical protein